MCTCILQYMKVRIMRNNDETLEYGFKNVPEKL